jgi:hypothetical protein
LPTTKIFIAAVGFSWISRYLKRPFYGHSWYRRARRWSSRGRDMAEMPEGPFRCKSAHTPVSLSEIEEALFSRQKLSVEASFGTIAAAAADRSLAPSATKSFCMSTTIITVLVGSM